MTVINTPCGSNFTKPLLLFKFTIQVASLLLDLTLKQKTPLTFLTMSAPFCHDINYDMYNFTYAVTK